MTLYGLDIYSNGSRTVPFKISISGLSVKFEVGSLCLQFHNTL